MAGEEFKVRVGVELDDASFNSLKNQINSVAQKEPIKVKVDTKDAESSVKSLKTQIESLGKSNITLSGAAKIESVLNDIASSVKEMKASLSSLGNVKIKPQMDVSDIKKAATEVKHQTESIATAATKTKRIISGVSTEAIKITGKNLTGINKKLGINGLALNKRQISDITGYLKDMKVALDDITVGSGKNTIEITTHGFDEAGRKITKIMKAKAVLDDDGGFVKWDWNVDTTKATKQIDTLGEAIKKSKSIIKDFNGNTIQTNVKVIEDSFKKLGESSNQSLKEMQTAFNSFMTEYSQWQASSTKNNPAEVKAMVSAYNELTTAMTKAKNEEKLLRSNASLSKATDSISKEFVDLDLAFKKAGANVSSLDAKFSKISGQSKEAETAVEKLKSAYDELGTSIKKNTTQVIEGDDTTREVHNINEIVLALENYKKAYEEATAAVKKNKAEGDKALSTEKYKNDKTNFINQIERYKSDNSAALLKYGKQLDELIAKTKQLNGVSLNGVKQEFKELQNTIEKDGLATQSFGDKLKTQFKRYAAYFSIASVTMEATQALRQMYQSVLEIDTAMTELYRVTDLTSQGYANLYDNMIASAKQYGATLSDIINSTADWSRAGFDPETANGLAGITMMYEHIADIDYDEATQNLLTAYKGFQGQLDSMFNNDAEASVTYIADILNELDNNYAVTAAGVGEAMRRSAASMDVANNSIEQTAALITGAIEVTQDPEGAGNALKVVSMRLRGAAGELEDLGEEVDSNVENLTQMQGKILNLTHGKVNIFEDNGDFKSTYDILVGIADVYDQLSDMEQADLLETIAGKHRANTVASIIGNIDQVKAAYQSSTEASGSASEENEKYMNSLEGHLNKLTTAWQSFSNSFLSSGFLKGLISTASGFLNVIDSIVDKMGTIPTIISLIAAGLSGIKNIGFFKTVKDEATGFVTKMELSFAGLKGKIGELKDLLNNSVKFDFDKDFINGLGLNEKTLNQYIAGGQKSEYLEDATDAVIDYVKATDKASISVEDFRGKQMAAAAQVNGSANTFKSVSNVISVFNSMTKETEKTQQGFVSAIANSNPKLASYLSSVKAGAASFPGYVKSLAAATAKTIGLTVVTTALNAALTMGISILVSAAMSAIDSWIHKNEKLAESVQDVIDKYNEQKSSLKDAKSVKDEVVTSDGSKSRYEELSKGVDSLGKNVSLTADEYSEYLDITSRIASTFPELIQGYDSQGNAILSCKGNVEELTEAYNKLGHAANKEILSNSSIDDIQKDFKNDIEDLNDSGWLNDSLTSDGADALAKMINSKNVGSAVEKNVKGYYTQIAKALKDAKIGDYESINPYFSSQSALEEYITECIESDRNAVKKIVDAHNSELDDAASEMKQAAQAVLSEAFDFSDSDYYGMNESLKSIAQQAVNSLDGEFYKKVVDNGGNVKDYINSMIEALDGLDGSGDSAVEMALDLQTKFNNGEVSYGEYADALAKAQSTIDSLDGVDKEIKEQLKLSLDTKDAENQYETFVNRLTEAGWFKDAAETFARSLSSSEMEVAFDLVANGELKVENADELRKQLEEQAKLNEAMSFSIDMEAETEGVEALTTALTESNSATGLTVESMEKLKARYKDLDGYNPATLFQETANGLMLNASAARELEKAYAESKLSEANDNLTTLKQRYDELGAEIQKCDDASKKASLINEREDIRQQITQIAEYATALDGLTSAYTDWQAAESAGNNRDMYSNVQSAMEGVKEELDLGWIDDGTKEYFDLIWGDNWNGAGKGISDYRAQWDTLDDTIEGTTYSLQDFFKTDDDGNLTSKGIYNFLDAVKQKQKELGKDWVQTDKNGNIVSFDFGIDGTKAVADALGISEDLVNIFLKASQDCGFVVNFDGTYKQLADLQNEAMAANDKLKELGKTDYTFNFDSKNIKDLNNQLEVAEDILADESFWNKDGTFNFNAKGATEAMQVVSTLQATIDNLDNKYIGLTVDDSSLKEPLEKLQEYESTTAEINQLKLDPKANTEEIEAAEKKLHDIADYFYKLDNTEKKKLGIDVDASLEEIQKMIENGEIEIPAALDIQTSINDNLEDLVDIALYSSGMLDETRAKEIEQKFNVKAVVSDDSDTVEDLEKSVHERFADYSGTEDLDADVNVNVEGEQDVRSLIDYLGGLSDERIQVIANVIGKVDVEQLQSAISGIDNKYIELIAQALGSGDVNALANAINKIPDENVKKAIAKAFGYNSVEELDSAIRGMDNKTVKAIAQALGISDVNSLKSVVNSLDDKTVQAIAEAIGQGKVQSLIDTIANLKDKTVTTSVITKYVKQGVENGAALGKWAVGKRTGVGGVDGTANVNGAAFANGTVGKAFKNGNWGTNGSGTALVGELGQELLVRDGNYYTIGDNGAEFIDYKKGDIIFNAGQTRQLFEQGKITNGQTRGRAFSNGNATADDVAQASVNAVKDSAYNSASGTIDGGIVTYEIQFNISDETDWLDELSEIMESNATETGLTADQVDKLTKKYGKLKSFNANKLFQHTASGIKVNNQELSKLNKEYQETNYQKIRDDYSGLVSSYNSLTEAIGEASNAADRASLITQRNELSEQIDLIRQLGTEYSSTCSQYNKWVDSTSSAEGYDAYGNIATYKEQVEDEISRGFLGNASKEYIQLLSGTDLTDGTIDDYYDAYLKTKEAVTGLGYSIQGMFTVDDDGNVNAYGVHAFMDSVKNDFADMYDEATNTWDFSQENIQRIVDGYNMNADAIGMILQAANDAGYNVQWKDIFGDMDFSTTPFEDMVKYAQLAEEELSQLFGKDYQFNFASSTLDDAVQEIDNAKTAFSELTDENGVKFLNEDGTINFQADGASDVAAIMRALTIQKQQLETPVVMQIDASKLNGTSQELQDYVVRTQELNDAMQQYEIAVNSGDEEDIAAKTEQLQTAAKNYTDAATKLKESDSDVAAQLKVGTGKNIADQLQEELNSETVNVQAVLKIKDDMSGNINEVTADKVAGAVGKTVAEITNEDYYNLRAQMIVEGLDPGEFFESDGNGGYRLNLGAWVATRDFDPADYWNEDGTINLDALAIACGLGDGGFWRTDGDKKILDLDAIATAMDLDPNTFWNDDGTINLDAVAKILKLDPKSLGLGDNKVVMYAEAIITKTTEADTNKQDDSSKSTSQYGFYDSSMEDKTSGDTSKYYKDVEGSTVHDIFFTGDTASRIVQGMTLDDFKTLMKIAYKDYIENGYMSEEDVLKNAETNFDFAKNDNDFAEGLFERTGLQDVLKGVNEAADWYSRFNDEEKEFIDRYTNIKDIDYLKDVPEFNDEKIGSGFEKIDEKSITVGEHLTNLFDIIKELSNEDFQSVLNATGLKDDLSNVDNFKNYLSELAKYSPNDFVNVMQQMGFNSVSEDNVEQSIGLIDTIDGEHVQAYFELIGLSDALTDADSFKIWYDGLDKEDKQLFIDLVAKESPEFAEALTIAEKDGKKTIVYEADTNEIDNADKDATKTSEKTIKVSELKFSNDIQTEASTGSTSAYSSEDEHKKTLEQSSAVVATLKRLATATTSEIFSAKTANAAEADTSQYQLPVLECIPTHLVANDVDTSGVTDADGDVDVPAEAQVDKVNDPNGVLNDPFQIAVDDSGIKDALQDGETLKSMLLGLSDDDVLAFGNSMLFPDLTSEITNVEALRNLIAGMSNDTLTGIFANTGIESALADAESFNEYLNGLTDDPRQVILDLVMSKDSEEQKVTADVTGNTTELDEAVEKPRETISTIIPDVVRVLSRMAQGFSAVAKITPLLTTSTLTVAINTLVSNVTKSGSSKADGTAYVNGTVGKAFKHGNWGTDNSGTALVGELGQEMVVRDGQFFTIGDNGAEFFQYKKNDIIFNAGQTKQLFEQGKITNGRTRGRAFYNGYSATVSGSKFEEVSRNNTGYVAGKKYGSSSSSSSSGSDSDSSDSSDASDEADEFEETLDWIETKLDRIERAISKLDTTASSVYKNWGTRNEALVNQISKVGEEINLQQQAYDRYIAQANSVGLSEDYASKVRDGTIDIETITDEDLNDKISDYKEW